MRHPKKLLILLAIVLIAAGIVHWLAREPADPLARFPHVFLKQPTYDPADLIIVVAPITQASSPEGCLPAWRCDDPAFAEGGRPWLFPLSGDEHGRPRFPAHPRLKRAPDPKACSRFVTPEGAELLQRFQAGVQR